MKTLGKLRFRFSYGQNQLRHSIETGWLAAALAHEIGANVEIARAGGLLHDLGKALDREMEGTHALLGAEIARDSVCRARSCTASRPTTKRCAPRPRRP